MIAVDVAYDRHMNALILDVNSGPSATPPFFDKRRHPQWLLDERSRLIREALDIVQEVAFYKVLASMGRAGGTGEAGAGLTDALKLRVQRAGGWTQLFHEVQEDFAGARARSRENDDGPHHITDASAHGQRGGGKNHGEQRGSSTKEAEHDAERSGRALLRRGECVEKTFNFLR